MKKKIIAVAAVGAAALVIGGAVFFATHFRVAGHFYSKNADTLDVRGDALSPEDYETLREIMKEADIFWDVPLSSMSVPTDAVEITLNDLTNEDVALFGYLPELKRVDASGCDDYDALFALMEQRPEVAVSYQVNICGGTYAGNTQEITVVDASADELMENLRYLPELETVQLTGALPPAENLSEVMGAYPNVKFVWNVTFDGEGYQSTDTKMDLEGKSIGSRAALEGVLPYLPAMQEVNLCGTDLSQSDLKALADTWPDVDFIWEMETFGQTLRTDAEEVDISEWKMENVSEVEALLPYFTNLQKLVMCDCGIDNETMDAFNRRYEDIKIVWSVKVSWRSVRTDATWFMPFRMQLHDDVSDLSNLRYCTDMECIDAGHLAIKDIEFVRPLNKLRWLIIGDTAVSDISPVENHTNLVFFEMFKTKVTDYTPLLSCTGLEDLNLGYTYGDAEIIAKMTWLKNLWWHRPVPPWGGPETETRLNLGSILPDAQVDVSYTPGSTDGGWRQIPNYFAMRDFLGVFYMDEP